MSTYAVFVLNCTRKDCQSCASHPYHSGPLRDASEYRAVRRADPYVLVDTFATPARAYWAADMLNELVRS
jgi:hypothetical protein